jgi:hypothetical protein
MDESGVRQPRHALRLSLLATGAGLLWAGLALFAPTDAHAAQNDPGQGGLVGIVSDAADGASGLVGSVTDTVAHVAPPVAPVTTAVSQTVTAVTGTVDQAVSTVPAVVPPVAPIVEPVVTQVVQPVVDHVAQPVVDTVAEVTAPIPVVGELVDAVDVSGTVEAVPGVVDSVDGVVDVVLEGPIDTILPPLPGTSLPTVPAVPGLSVDELSNVVGPTSVVLFASEPAVSVSAGSPAASARPDALFSVFPDAALPQAEARAGDTTPPAGPVGSPWPADGSPAPGSGAGSGGAPGAAALLPSTFLFGGHESSAASPSAGDRIPACPVFETDASPD